MKKKKYKVFCHIYVHEEGGISYQVAQPWSDDVHTNYIEALKELLDAKADGHDKAFIAEVE